MDAEQAARLAAQWRREGNELLHRADQAAHYDGDTDTDGLRREAEELFTRADSVDGSWPLREVAS